MDQIEQDPSNEDAETVLHSADEVSDEALLHAAANEAAPSAPAWACRVEGKKQR
jgi:hypothetical protein